MVMPPRKEMVCVTLTVATGELNVVGIGRKNSKIVVAGALDTVSR